MSYINGRNEVIHRDRPGFDSALGQFNRSDKVKPVATVLTRPGGSIG